MAHNEFFRFPGDLEVYPNPLVVEIGLKTETRRNDVLLQHETIVLHGIGFVTNPCW